MYEELRVDNKRNAQLGKYFRFALLLSVLLFTGLRIPADNRPAPLAASFLSFYIGRSRWT